MNQEDLVLTDISFSPDGSCMELCFQPAQQGVLLFNQHPSTKTLTLKGWKNGGNPQDPMSHMLMTFAGILHHQNQRIEALEKKLRDIEPLSR